MVERETRNFNSNEGKILLKFSESEVKERLEKEAKKIAPNLKAHGYRKGNISPQFVLIRNRKEILSFVIRDIFNKERESLLEKNRGLALPKFSPTLVKVGDDLDMEISVDYKLFVFPSTINNEICLDLLYVPNLTSSETKFYSELLRTLFSPLKNRENALQEGDWVTLKTKIRTNSGEILFSLAPKTILIDPDILSKKLWNALNGAKIGEVVEITARGDSSLLKFEFDDKVFYEIQIIEAGTKQKLSDDQFLERLLNLGANGVDSSPHNSTQDKIKSLSEAIIRTIISDYILKVNIIRVLKKFAELNSDLDIEGFSSKIEDKFFSEGNDQLFLSSNIEEIRKIGTGELNRRSLFAKIAAFIFHFPIKESDLSEIQFFLLASLPGIGTFDLDRSINQSVFSSMLPFLKKASYSLPSKIDLMREIILDYQINIRKNEKNLD